MSIEPVDLGDLRRLAVADRHHDCCQKLYCPVCWSHVSCYNTNSATQALRPQAIEFDYWAACDNGGCVNATGEGFFMEPPHWAVEVAQ
jgi:hypothetical protein